MQTAAAFQDAPQGEQLSARNFSRLAAFIQNYSGIKMPVSKRTMLEGRLRRRMRALRIDDANAYCRFLFEEDGMAAEMVHLIDAVTTNKTDFFREPAHFDFIERTALPALVKKGQRKIKVWSAACSIGAEPYTLAMVLEDFCADHRGADYSILATDISSDVLGRAVAGRYPEAMIEPVSAQRRQRYVMQAKDRSRRDVRIVPALRSKIDFGRLNLMDDAYPVESGFDMVFCRNILIYFDKPTQTRVLQRLCSHLRPGGWLFLGHSESIVGVDLPVTALANTVFQKR